MIIGPPADIDIIEQAPDSVLVQVAGVVDVAAVGQLRRHLRRLVDSDAWSVVVDLSAVARCDYRVLAVLDDARCRLQAAHGRLDVRGLDPESLTGFTEATLRDVLAAYRASPGVAPGHWPGEPGGARVPGMCNDAERRLAQVCVGLVSTAAGGAEADVIGVADRLTEQCARHLGVDATVLLTPLPGRGPGALVVASASASGARSVAEVEVGTGEGPGVTCVRSGAPASAPDLAERTQQWPRYVRAALEYGVRGARALPLRVRAAMPGRGSETIGALGLLSDEAGPMAPADLGVAQAFADLAVIALASELGRRAEGRHAAAGTSGAMADLAIVEQAKGVLAERDRLTMAQAHDRLLQHSRAHDLRLGMVARGVVTGVIKILDPISIRPVGDRPGC